MFDVLDSANLQQLAAALCGVYSLTLCDGSVRLLCRELPGRSICVVTRVGHVTYVIVDLSKPNAPRTAWNMIREWRDGLLEPTVTPDGHVDLVPLPRIAEHEGPATLMLA